MATNRRSSAQALASRQNGARAHGPTNAAGLARSARNALQHGPPRPERAAAGTLTKAEPAGPMPIETTLRRLELEVDREAYAMSTADPNRVILTGENPFLRLSPNDGDPNTTDASFWRIIFSPAGPGHVLYLKSELTENHWRIWSDNIAMARWLQATVQGMINAETKDASIPVVDAVFSKTGDPRYFWTERVVARDEEITLTWYEMGEPLLLHTQPDQLPERPYGVCTILIPAGAGRLARNGVEAAGRPWPREREGRPFSTSALAFSESWTESG